MLIANHRSGCDNEVNRHKVTSPRLLQAIEHKRAVETTILVH